jgi:D-alanyl-D-alanine carboxypeptidase (penicillin-binding protein 5/6)
LSASATRDDLTLISVVMGSPTSTARFAGASKLLDYGFANYDAVKLAEKGESMGMAAVEKGEPSLINAVTPKGISVLIKKGDRDTIRGELVYRNAISAPVAQGEQIGELVVYQKDAEIARHPVVAGETAEKAGLLRLYLRMLKALA